MVRIVLYSTMDTVFEEDFRLKSIYRILRKSPKLGYNELENDIVFKKKIMSQRIFREKLAKLVKLGLVIRSPEKNSNRVWYSTTKQFFELETRTVKILKLKISELKKLFKMLKRDYKKLPILDKADAVTIFLRLLYPFEYNLIFYYMQLFPKATQLKKFKKEIELLKYDLLILTNSHDKKINLEVQSLISKYFFDSEKIRWDQLNHFLYNPNRFNEIKY